MKEIRFSLQCGASNRKALAARRCSQCTGDHGHGHGDSEPMTITTHQLRRRSHSNCSSSSASITLGTNLQPSKHRTTLERTSDLDKFDTLLMLAAERTSRDDTRRKQQRVSSTSVQTKPLPLLLVESRKTLNHVPTIRSQHVRFTSAGLFDFFMSLTKKDKRRCLYLPFYYRFVNTNDSAISVS
jgi:hypothetical protein